MKIDLSEKALEELPITLGAKTTVLDINSNKLTELAPLAKCQGLEELHAYNNKLKNLDVMASLKSLRVINVYNNGIRKLPTEIGELTLLEDVNLAGNKLMALSDGHFRSWQRVTHLNLYDNNLVRMGSLAPLIGLEELRMHANNLEEIPPLGPSHPKLTVIEMHRNRLTKIPENYFFATPALERLSLWGNMLEGVPDSLCGCNQLVGVQLQENSISALPEGPWPTSLETIFLETNAIVSLPVALSNCHALKRINFTGLPLDANALHLADYLKGNVLRFPDGIFWAADGQKFSNEA